MVDILVDFMIIEVVDSKVGVGTMTDTRGEVGIVMLAGGFMVEAGMDVDLRIRIG